MSGIAAVVNRGLGCLGLRIERTRRAATSDPYSGLFRNRQVPDIERLLAVAAGVPGMLSEESARALFLLCYTQQLEGDVVETGSWQGYSTSFLARAVAESRNGRMYAIDHFRGNVGKESFYKAGESDLSDLPRNFRKNIESVGLAETVRLKAMSNADAARELRQEDARIRFLFIDGDHTRAGVQRDIDLFFPMLLPGAIVVFDDCNRSAPGVIEAIDELFERGACRHAFTYANTLVLTTPVTPLPADDDLEF